MAEYLGCKYKKGNEKKWLRYGEMIKINKGNKKKNGYSSTNKKNVIYFAKKY